MRDSYISQEYPRNAKFTSNLHVLHNARSPPHAKIEGCCTKILECVLCRFLHFSSRMTNKRKAEGEEVATNGAKKSRSAPTLITKDERIKGFGEIKALAKTLNLDTDGGKPAFIAGRSGNADIGTVPVTESTCLRYADPLKSLLDFCIYTGDLESAIILYRAECPRDPPPVKVGTAIAFMKYMVLRKGEPVKDHQTNLPIVVRGQTLLAVGTWTGVSSIGILRSALGQLHRFYPNLRDQYHSACPQCSAIPPLGLKKGEHCGKHQGRSHPSASGCITTSLDFKNHLKMLDEYVKTNYDSGSSAAFLPSHLRSLRSHLMSKNNLESLMHWTIIMLGTRLFLRVQEVLELQIESFQPEWFLIDGKRVISLCVKIKGKTDKQDKYFQVYDDPEFPELSPVRPLLLFIAASKRTGGFIFPAASQMHEAVPTKSYSYQGFLKTLKNLVEYLNMDLTAATNGRHLYAGTHMLRKTGFVLAFFGIKMEMIFHGKVDANDHDGIPIEDLSCLMNDVRFRNGSAVNITLLTDPRHTSASSTMTYLSDAGSLFGVYRRMKFKDPKQRVGPYFPIYIEHLGNFRTIALQGDLSRGKNTMSLPELSNWFVSSVMQVHPSLVLHDNVSAILQQANNLNVESKQEQSATQLMGRLYNYLPPELYSQLTNHIDSLASTEGNHICLPTNGISIPPTPKANDSQTVVPAVRKNRKEFKTSKEYRKLYASNRLTPFQKVSLLVEYYDEITALCLAGFSPRANDPDRCWYYKNFRAPLCVKHCFGGRINDYLECCKEAKMPAFGTTFRCPKGVSHRVSLR